MLTSDWRHIDDLPVDQFNTVVFEENACLTHAVERLDGKPVPAYRVFSNSGQDNCSSILELR